MQDVGQNKFQKLKWMLDETVPLSDNQKDEYLPPYGDVTKLNSCRLIMDSVGAQTLKEIGKYAVKLLDTSVAIYEANGDYAFGMFSSGWCRIMDSASRELCKTDDNQEALSCGKWLCHENCWNDSAKKAIETGRNSDIECVGGIHLYAEPIYAGKKVIGTVNIGYGDPPKDPDQLKALADAFGVDPEKLKEIGESYKSRPTFIIDVTKKLLGAFAKLIGEIVEKAEAERKQKEAQEREVHLKNVLKAILDVNQLIVKENDPHRLIQKACENLTGTMGYFNAWIALLDKDSRCVTQTGAAVSDGNFDSVRDNLNRGVFPACMQCALETSDLVVIKDLAAECHDCPLASSYGGRAALSHRLEHEGTIFGILSVSTPAQFARDTEEQDLFLEVSNDLAFALSKIETDQELHLKNQIIGTTPQLMSIVSRDYRYLVVNDAYCRVYGMAPENIAGRPVEDFVSPAVFEREIRSRLDRCLTGETVQYEIKMDFPGTGPCWMRTEYTPYRDKDNRIVGVVSHSMDITGRKRVEDELRRARELSERIIEDGPVAITLVNRDGKIVFANRHAEQLFNLEKPNFEALEYNSPEWLITDVDGSPFPNERLPFHQVMLTGQPVYDIQHAINTPAAGRKILSINGAPLHDEQGRIDRAVFAIQDITGRKQAEAEQEKLQAQLAQAQKMESVGRLAGGVAHDFNNMLSVIIGNTELAMENMAPDDSLHNNLGEIFSAANRSADITRQLLAFARKQTIAPEVLDLNRTIESMLKMLRRLIGEDIDLAWLPGADVWPVRMDPSQIDQILANLCINARDAIKDVGKITIETGTATFDPAYCAEHPGFVNGDFVLLAVSDDGCGMDQGTLANLFEPFFTTKDVDKGTGLGLATVYGIVKQNDGFINVYSEPGQGTSFRTYLPRWYPAETESPEKKTSGKIHLDGTETILLVEDEPSILRMTRMMLESNGYKVLVAGTPGEAIALAREHTGEIHLLITDVVMPEMNGRDLAGNLLSLYPNLKRLFMSGYTANVIAHHGILDDGVLFIQKPFAKQDLAIKVRKVLDEPNQTTQQ